MNKLLTKIVGVALGATMAVGVGVGVAVNNDRKVIDSQVEATTVLTFDVSSNPGGWPTTNSTTATNYTYTLNAVTYTFSLKNVKCNSGYLMCTSTAALGLPAISGKKLTKVVATNSGSCSTSTKVGISSSNSSENYISGGATKTWSTTSTDYTYNLSSTSANTMYYMYITNKNAQITQIQLTYDDATPSSVSVTYDANGATSGSIPTDSNSPYSSGATVTVLGNSGNLAKTGFTWAGWNTQADGNGTDYVEDATFTISANTTLYAKWIKTLDAITAIGGTVTGSVSNSGTYNWDFSNVTVTGTLSGVANQNVKSYVDLSSTTQIPGTVQENYSVSVTAAKKSNVVGSATTFTNNSVSGSVEAAKLTYTLVLDYTKMLTSGISYPNENANPKQSSATCANHDDIDIDWASNQVQRPSSKDYMQFQSSNGYIYNTTELPGTISNVTLTDANNNSATFTVYYGDSEHPTSSTTVGGKFFTVKVGSSTGYLESITVTFLVSDKPKVQLTASNMNLDVASGVATPTITDGTDPVSGYELTSNDNYIASVTQDKKIQPTGYGKAIMTVTKTEDFGHIYLPTTFIVTVGDNSKQTSIMEFTEAADGSATAADGVVWTITANQNEQEFSEIYGINYGSNNNKVSSLVLTTPADSQRIIKNVVVEAMSADSGSTITVAVGETSFTCSKSNSLNSNVTTFNFSGNTSGAITITMSGTASSKYGVKSISVLYVGDAATSFASTFLGAISCDADGINKPTFTIKEGSTYWTWALLKAEFDVLSPTDQAKFAPSVEGDENGTTIERAIARYDYIVGKYYTGNVDRTLISSDFMNRNPSVPSGINRVNTQSTRNNNATVATVVIISVISLSTLCGYFLLRKRKEEK